MTRTLLRRGALATTLACAVAMTASGCGDNLICQSESLVIIQSPADVISVDSNAGMDGIQTDVVVRSTFGPGVSLVLTVEDSATVVLSTVTGTTDDQGDVTFEDVTVPPAGAQLRVVGDAGECGGDEDVRAVEVIAGSGCELDLVVDPVVIPYYAPLGVFNAALDGNANAPGFQGDVIVRTSPSHEVKLYLSSTGTVETQVGSGTANAEGEVRLAVNLPEGQDSLRAQCAGPGNLGTRSTGLTSVWVDTVTPSCEVTSPVPTTSITLALDEDGMRSNGVQLELVGHATGADVAGEAASFVLTRAGGVAVTAPGTAVDAAGNSTADVTFAPPTTPADYGVRFATADHAGNACVAMYTYRVVYDGCAITVVQPTGVATVDADGNPGNGAQVDIILDVADACIGRAITSDCGATDPGATIGAGGAATLRATVCDGLPCESAETCTVRVTSSDGIETTAGVALRFDNQAPNVSVQVVAPAGVSCGGTVVPAQDVDAVAAGIQISMRVASPLAEDRRLRITNASGTATLDANATGGEVVVTLANGSNDFVGVASDVVGNTAMTPVCRVSLADIAVTFTGSAADGTVGGPDGTVNGSNLSFTLTGTVSAEGASVAVTVDGGTPLAATVNGTTWSLPVTLAARPAPYAIVASATQAGRVGSASLALTVDLTGPTPVGGLGAVANTRRSIRLSFTAGSDGGAAASSYEIRYSTTVLTDANFDTTGVGISGPAPAGPGAAQVAPVAPLRTGTPYWVGIAAVDGAGNRSVAQIAGPITPTFDQSPVYAAPNTVGNAGFGNVVVRGRFNDDVFDDVAVASPFVTSGGLASAGEVYIYLGSEVGLATAPAVTIRGTVAGGQLGNGLARVRWSSVTRDDLAIAAPFAATIYVFDGGPALPSGVVNATAAQRRLVVNASSNWFTGSGFGWKLATADHDGDSTDDLVATAVFGNNGAAGAAVVFYGGTVPSGTVAVSDLSAAGSGTAVMRMYEISSFDFPGLYLHNLGPTMGATDLTDDFAVGSAEDATPGADILVFRGAGRPATAGVTREPFTPGRDVVLRYVTADAGTDWGALMGSIDDQNGDGARDIVIGAPRDGADQGSVHILDGNTMGTDGVAAQTAAGVLIAAFQETGIGATFGSAIINNADASDADVDGDGHEDLVVGGRATNSTQSVIDVWFGPLTAGIQSPPAPDLVITGPASFQSTPPSNGGSALNGAWADVNGDGLDDICWTDWTSAGLDGGMQVLWDDGN